jgi:hypothetical protein
LSNYTNDYQGENKMIVIGIIALFFSLWIIVFSIIGLAIGPEIEKDKILRKFRFYPKEYFIIRNIFALFLGLFILLYGILTIINSLI